MSRFFTLGRMFGLGLGVVSVVLIGGCGQKPTTETTDTAAQIHKIQSLPQDELNAPLSKQARSKGAQVAPPPIR